MRKHLAFFIAILAMFVSGCASSKVSVVPVTGTLTHSFNSIAMSPDSGLLAEAVAFELSNRGYTIIDSATTSRTMVRLNLNEIDIARPEGLTRLREQGIDALLTVRAVGGYDEQPQSATARVSSTHTGQVVAGITWQNGWGGEAGSIADRTMRKGLAEAAKEIADALAKSLRTDN